MLHTLYNAPKPLRGSEAAPDLAGARQNRRPYPVDYQITPYARYIDSFTSRAAPFVYDILRGLRFSLANCLLCCLDAILKSAPGAAVE